MLEFIERLKDRYRSVMQGTRDGSVSYEQNLASLTLAAAALRKLELSRNHPDTNPQMAVIGPTQAGKSTVVNLLLGEPLAGVSALAGFTVHPQGFCIASRPDHYPWLPAFFTGYRRVPLAELTDAPYRAYALSETGESPLPPSLLWDTPDFDSIDASGYRDAVLRTAALADALLLVVSKDKYADQRVWETLELLFPLGRPMAVCINKVEEESREAVIHSFRNHLREKGLPLERFPLCTLPYRKELDDAGRGMDPQAVESLHNQVKRLLTPADREEQARHTYRFIRHHWPQWLSPVHAEQAAEARWREMVEHALEKALADYRRDYLDHPQNYETFQQAIAELLTLLEIPLLADSLAKARRLVTWPLRQVVETGKSLFGKTRTETPKDDNQERRLLNQIAHHTLIHLAEEALRLGETEAEQETWWKNVARLLREERSRIEQRFEEEVADYQRRFRPEIERSARRLYEQLEQQPAMLNTLRTARVTTDAAAVVLAVKSGGLSVHDLVVAPAMLSLTSMLAESTLGHYMDRIAAELKQRQLETVRETLLASLGDQLTALENRLDPAQRFGISAEEVAAAEQELERLEHGD